MATKEAVEIQEGKTLNLTLTGDVDGGDFIPFGTGMTVVACTAGLTGEEIAVETSKVWEANATTADAIAIGDVVYFDATARELTTTATDNSRAGRAVSAKAGSTAGTVLVKLNAA